MIWAHSDEAQSLLSYTTCIYDLSTLSLRARVSMKSKYVKINIPKYLTGLTRHSPSAAPDLFISRNLAGFIARKKRISILIVHSHKLIQAPGLTDVGHPFAEVRSILQDLLKDKSDSLLTISSSLDLGPDQERCLLAFSGASQHSLSLRPYCPAESLQFSSE